jgi:hypothetical protein
MDLNLVRRPLKGLAISGLLLLSRESALQNDVSVKLQILDIYVFLMNSKFIASELLPFVVHRHHVIPRSLANNRAYILQSLTAHD